MNNYYQELVIQKKVDYTNLVVPVLRKFSHKLLNNDQVRVRWGKDWNDFTVYMTNPLNDPTWEIDDLIHSIWKGINTPNRLIATCFVENKGIGPVSSLAITDLYTMANGLKNYGILHKNKFNKTTFLTLPFGHPTLSKNISGIGIRTIGI